MSYNGFSAGAKSVFLPRITRRFFGFVTPIIIQNLGAATTTATAQFVQRGGGAGPAIIRVIDPGRSQFIDPNSTPGLVDGGAYAVTITADQPVAVVVNTHHDDSFVAQPVAYSADGIANGATTLYAPYFAKNASRVGVSTLVVQNGGTGIAAAVSVIGSASAMGYTALTQATAKYFLPNVTRTLGGATGWTTPILLQSATASSATLQWFRFSDGGLVTAQTVPLTPGSGVRIDPRNVPNLTDDTQYAVVASAT